MKKLFALILAICMILSMVACSNSASDKKDDGKLNVVLVVPNNLGDKAFSDMVWAGVTMAKEKHDLNDIKCIELLGETTTQIPTLTELCESGEWDIIVTGSNSLLESIKTVANKFPEQKFLVYDAKMDFSNGQFANCSSFLAMQNEGSYLGGALAAMMSETGIIGFIGGKEATSIMDFLVGYIEGAQYVNPDIVVRASFVGSYTDTATAKELALAQNNQGSDVIFAVCSGAGLGIYEAAAENGFWALGVDSDQSLILEENKPESAKAILTSVIKNFDVILCDAIGEVVDGTFTWGTHTSVNLAKNGVGLSDNSYYQTAVPEEYRNQITEITQKIKDGEILVDTAIGMDSETYNQIKESAS